jgi:hypothetical protein
LKFTFTVCFCPFTNIKKELGLIIFSLSSKNSHQEDFNMIRNEPLFTGTPAARKNSGHRTVIRVDSQGKKSKEETRYAFNNYFY